MSMTWLRSAVPSVIAAFRLVIALFTSLTLTNLASCTENHPLKRESMEKPPTPHNGFREGDSEEQHSCHAT